MTLSILYTKLSVGNYQFNIINLYCLFRLKSQDINSRTIGRKIDLITIAYVVIKNKTNTSAIVYTYLNDGSQTSAKVNLRLKGY